MTKGLQQYFPMIRTREEVLKDVESRPQLSTAFYNWTREQQNEFLDFCTGVRGIKLLYDSFFKEIINPEYTPERLEEFLSLIFRQRIRIRKVLPNDSSRIAEETSLLILDILIELEDGSLADIEVQKLGYKFPGQRCACYSADLLLRQYKRLRSEKNKQFSYKDIKHVYTIIIFEKSSREFHRFPDTYLHWLKQKSDTGLQMDLLQEYIFIPLDIFRKNLHNNGIKNIFDAWLTFLSEDDPGMIEQLINSYPQFIPLYEEVYEMCRNTERVMNLYSKELLLLDKNTVQLMIDEMQDTIEDQGRQINQKNEQLSQKDAQLSQQAEQLNQQEQLIKEMKRKIAELETHSKTQ